MPWRRKWQPTPAFLPGKSPGQRSLVGYSPWGRKAQAWATEHAHNYPERREGKGEGISKWEASSHFKMFVLTGYLPVKIWAKTTMRKHTYSVYFYRIFKSLFWIVTILFLFNLGLFGHEACGISSPQTGIKPIPFALEGAVLTTGPPGISLFLNILLKHIKGSVFRASVFHCRIEN